jgi:hypothetical protein
MLFAYFYLLRFIDEVVAKKIQNSKLNCFTLLLNHYVPLDACLSAAVHAINSTAGPERLIPVLLVFGMIPRLPSSATIPLLNQKRRFKMRSVLR